MKKNINIAIVGLGQIGIYLYNEINIKKSAKYKLIQNENAVIIEPKKQISPIQLIIKGLFFPIQY